MSPSDPARPSLNGWNAAYLDAMHEQWRTDPDSVDPLGVRSSRIRSRSGPSRLRCQRVARCRSHDFAHCPHSVPSGQFDHHYRDIGHLHAKLILWDPDRPSPAPWNWSPSVTKRTLDQSFDPGHLPLNSPATLRDIIAHLESTYCGSIGAEYMHIRIENADGGCNNAWNRCRTSRLLTPSCGNGSCATWSTPMSSKNFSTRDIAARSGLDWMEAKA